jgi:hypothetical protein
MKGTTRTNKGIAGRSIIAESSGLKSTTAILRLEMASPDPADLTLLLPAHHDHRPSAGFGENSGSQIRNPFFIII